VSTEPDQPASDSVTCPRCLLSFTPTTAGPANGSSESSPTGSGTAIVEPGPFTPKSTPTPQSLPERIGRFQIKRFLGEGAFGRVYEAYDPSLKRIVALKVARPERHTSVELVQRFQREAQAAAGLLHPHIVAVFDSGQDGPYHYIASAFVEGTPLDSVLLRLSEGGSRSRCAPRARQSGWCAGCGASRGWRGRCWRPRGCW
jgi:serine/threonine-protein kinase